MYFVNGVIYVFAIVLLRDDVPMNILFELLIHMYSWESVKNTYLKCTMFFFSAPILPAMYIGVVVRDMPSCVFTSADV